MALNSLDPNQWIRSYADLLYKYSVRRLNDSGLAEDIVQETFLSAWKSRSNFRGEASEKSWLFRICKNKIIDHYRRKDRGIIQLYHNYKYNDHFFDNAGNWIEEEEPSDWVIDCQKVMDSKEFIIVFDKCLQELKQMQQAAFSLKYLDGLDAEEICMILEISLSYYWVLIHRAKLHLRNSLKKNWINL